MYVINIHIAVADQIVNNKPTLPSFIFLLTEPLFGENRKGKMALRGESPQPISWKLQDVYFLPEAWLNGKFMDLSSLEGNARLAWLTLAQFYYQTRHNYFRAV
jgi:hypothetical protein